jgi:dihydrofolate reductase
MLKIVAAYSYPFRVIGLGGKLPWRYEEDLKKFKLDVEGFTLVGGAKTLRQVAFLKQHSICVHRDTDWNVVRQLANEKNVAIVGGEAVFAAGIALCDILQLTEIHKVYEGDRYFPIIPPHFKLVQRTQSATEPDLHFCLWRNTHGTSNI